MRAAVSVLVIASLFACSDNPFNATVDNVSGDYSATSFTSTDITGTTNWLTPGAIFHLNLAPNGTTTGRLFIPGGGEGGADFDADLAGTWTLSANTVEFNHTADTIVRDIVFRAGKNRLTSDTTLSGTTIRVVMMK